MNERAGTLENKHWLTTGPTETLVAQNLQDRKGLFSTHFEHYNVEDTAECYRWSDEKLLKVQSDQKCKTLLL